MSIVAVWLSLIDGHPSLSRLIDSNPLRTVCPPSTETAMSHNLANRSTEECSAIESHKAELYAFYTHNVERSRGEAAKIAGEKAVRKGKWRAWADEQINGLEPAQYQNMVKRALNDILSGASNT